MDTNASQPQPSLNGYEQSAQRQREKLAFVEHVCGVMIEDRFDNDEPPSPWRVFHGDVEKVFSKVACFDLMPDWAFEFMPGEFVFARFVSQDSARTWDANGEPLAFAGGRMRKPARSKSSPDNTPIFEMFWDARSNSPPVGASDRLGRGSPESLGRMTFAEARTQ